MRGVLPAIELPRQKQGRRVRTAGMVITRQRPGTAKGFVFLTLEDETGIAVTIEAYGNEQLNDNYKVKLNSSSSDFDVMAFQVQDVMREFSRNGWLADMTEYVSSDAESDWEDFQLAARDAVQLDGVVYGVPVMTERQIVYYRTDLLEAAGLEVPTTLEELETAIATLNDPDNGVFGIAMRGSRVPLVTQLSSFLYSYGADFQDAQPGLLISNKTDIFGDIGVETGTESTTVEGVKKIALSHALQSFDFAFEDARKILPDTIHHLYSDVAALGLYDALPSLLHLTLHICG